MSTPLHLNTTVKGSVGMLQEAAHGLRNGHQAAEQADDAHHTARNIAHASWRGAGGEAFLEDLQPHLNITRDLVVTCEAYARAFEDFAGSLEVVKNDMDKVRSTAASGGLVVQGPIVLRPERPGPGPTVSQYAGDTDSYMQAARAHAAVVADFNAKAAVFNTCLTVFKEARNKEKQAHIEFWEAVDAERGFDVDQAWNIGTTTASAALGGLAGMHNTRTDLLAKLQQLEPHSQAYQNLASGTTTLRGMSAKQRMYVMHGLARTKASEVGYRRQIRQLDKIGKYVPNGLPPAAAANPGQLMPNTKLGQQLGRAFKKLPWAGSTLTVFSEFRGAATGEQTWAKAVVDSAGKLSGGVLGGVAGATLCAPVLPPVGPILCSTAGAIGGGFAGGLVADFVVPEQTGMPEPVAKIPEHPHAPPPGAH